MTTNGEGVATPMFLDGVLISLNINFWRGRVALDPQDLGLEQVPEIFTLGRKWVVPREALEEFQTIYARADWLTDRFAFPFPTKAHFVPYGVLPAVLKELAELRERFHKATETLLDNYEQYRQQMVDAHPLHADALRRAYITPAALRKRFHFDYLLFEVRLPSEMRMRQIGLRQAQAEIAGRQEAVGEFRQQWAEQMEQFVDRAVRSLRGSVAEALPAFNARVANGEEVSGRGLGSIRRAVERFRELNFVGDGEVEAKLRELEGLVPESAKAYRDDAAVQAALAQASAEALAMLRESDVSKITGEYRRRVLL